MLFFKTKVSNSTIEGRGVFANETILRGSVVGNLAHDCRYISEDDYFIGQALGDPVITQTGTRLARHKFIYARPRTRAGRHLWKNEDFLNHSDQPSLLYHCGLLFAMEQIEKGQELTVNYAYFLAHYDATSFCDSRTGIPVRGLDGDQAVRQSARELLKLLTPDYFGSMDRIPMQKGISEHMMAAMPA